jgi:hypothetical protein
MTDEGQSVDEMLPHRLEEPEERTCLRLRLLSPLGRYPDIDVRAGRSFLIVRDDIAFSVVIVRPQAEHGLSDEHHSEIEIFAIEEMSFYACVSLSVHPGKGMVYVYPLQYHIDLPLTWVDGGVSILWNAGELLAKAREYAHKLKGLFHGDGRGRGDVLPPMLGGPKFDRHQEPFDAHLFDRLLEGADVGDWLSMRGLGALFRGDMVWLRREFAEFGVMAMHVAMEASFHMIRERLKREGNPDPSALDARAWLDAVFNPHIKTGAYFRDWYEDRIKTIHPSSRFGTYPYPPLATDDFYDLRSALHLVYVYLLTGENVMACDGNP